MPRYFFLPRVGEHYDHGFRGYNKYLKMEGNIKVAIDYDNNQPDNAHETPSTHRAIVL